MKKPVLITLIVLLLGIIVFCTWQIVDILQDYHKGTQTYDALEYYISVPETAPKKEQPQKEGEVQAEATEPEPVSPFPVVDFGALKAINADVIGWIYIPDTEVNYPILQGENNDEYLRHLLTGEYNSAGSIFLDAYVMGDFSGKNSPIYGHNMKNGSMFADVIDYKKQAFFDAHPTAMLMTPEKNYFVHLFSGYVTDSWGDAWNKAFTDAEFETWLQTAKSKSCFTSDVIPSIHDKVLTFSTCTYDTHDARFVVHGILEEYIPENQIPAG